MSEVKSTASQMMNSPSSSTRSDLYNPYQSTPRENKSIQHEENEEKLKVRHWTYTIVDMARAIEDTLEPKKAHIVVSAELHDIPLCTLKRYRNAVLKQLGNYSLSDRFNKILRILEQSKNQKLYNYRCLNEYQEIELVQMILDRSDTSRPFTELDIRLEAAKMVNSTGKLSQPLKTLSHYWFHQFQIRHRKMLTKRAAQKLTSNRGRALNSKNVDSFFNQLTKLYETYHFTPKRIFNLDEKGFDGEGQSRKRYVVRANTKHVNNIYAGFREHWTVQAIVNADGQKLPPCFVFKGKEIPEALLDGAPMGSRLGVQSAGYFSKDQFANVINHINVKRLSVLTC